MAVTRRPTAGEYPAKYLRRPSAYWRSKGLVLSFLGNRLVYSRDTPVIPTLTTTGTPKNQSGPHSDAIGFGTTFGTGTTDMLTGGVLPVSLRTQARSIFSSLYLVGYGGGGFGRVFQDVTGSGVAGGEALYPSNISTITYNNYKTSAAIVISWIFPTSAPLSRWFTLGIAVPNIVGTTAETGYCYLDGKISSAVANNTAAGAITSNVATNLTWGNRTSDGARGIDGMIGVTHFFEEALSPEDFADLDANPDCVWEVLDVRRTVSAGNPALTGQAVAVALGSLAPATSIVLTGNATAAASGTLLSTSLLPLTGQATVAAQGSVAPVIMVALTGVGTTADIGTLSVANQDITLPLTGLGTSVAQGTLAPGLSTPITGQATTVALGTVAPGVWAELTGQATTAAVGSVVPQTTVGLTGQAVEGALGTMVVPGDVTAALTGAEVITGLGTLTPVITPDQQPGKSHTDLTIRQMLVDYYTVAFAKKLDQPQVIAEPTAKQKLSRPSAKIQKVLQSAKTEVPSVRAARVAEAAELVAAKVAPDILADLTQSALKFNTLVLDFQAFEREQQRRRERDDADLLLLASVL